MFIFRRITLKDIQFKLKTGNKAFDEFAPNESLENYIKQDTIKEGQYLTYLLLEQKDLKSELLGLLRYRYAAEDDFIEQLVLTSVSEDIKKNIEKLLSLKKYKIVYLSRIGVLKKYHEMRISQIINNFFEFLIQREKQDTIIYAKILEDLTKIVGSKYQILGKGTDEKWGNYFFVSKIMEFYPKKV